MSKNNGSTKAVVEQVVVITPPNMQTIVARVRGTAPYCQHRFPEKARAIIRAAQAAGSTARSKKTREAKDFEECREEATYRPLGGGYGIPATAFRNAMISACKLVGYHMTRAKLSVFVLADDYDADSTPLVKITKGEPRHYEAFVRNATGVVDLRARPLWEPGWEAVVRIRFDADQFTALDVVNLLARAGEQVGIGEGRPDSPNGCGTGFGTFEIVEEA